MSRVVDRGAIFAGWVGMAMAAVIVVSFLLVIPIEPVIWFMSPFAGILIGYYANARSERRAGPWSRILANAAYAGAVTALTLTLLLVGTKAIFFVFDSGYRDIGLGGTVDCTGGADCVYQRYVDEPDGRAQLEAQGVTDVGSFTAYYWGQQLQTSATLFVVTFAGSIAGGLLYGVMRPRPKSPSSAGVAGGPTTQPGATSTGEQPPA
jgi:hypothetical protein